MNLWINRNKCGNSLRYAQLYGTVSSIWHFGQRSRQFRYRSCLEITHPENYIFKYTVWQGQFKQEKPK